jgi:hypothetical protein
MNPELKRFQELYEQQNTRLSDPGDGSGFSWVLEDRLRYKNMHREKDLALLREKWTIHVDEEIAVAAAGGPNTSPTAFILATRHKNDTDSKTRKSMKSRQD